MTDGNLPMNFCQIAYNKEKAETLGEFEHLAPHLLACITAICENNALDAERFGRWHQANIAEFGFFSIISPITGKQINCIDSIILPDKTTFFRFSETDILVASSNLGQGFPISAVLVLSKRILFNFGDAVWGVHDDHCRTLLTTLEDPIWAAIPSEPKSISFVTGDANFAHNLWNQLPFLDTITKQGHGRRALNFVYTHAPLGKIKDIYPENHQWTETYCPDTYLPTLNEPGRLFVPVGAFQISGNLRARIIGVANKYASESARILAKKVLEHPIIFWISVRTVNRTSVNQRDFLVTVISSLKENFPQSCIIVDGHSTQFDFENNASYNKEETAKIIEGDNNMLVKIANSATIISKSAKTFVFNAIGMSILDSIYLAKHAKFYVCHHGTTQHKIGWTSNIPGVIHSNLNITGRNPANWVAAQVEGGVVPNYLPSQYIFDFNSGNQSRKEFEISLAHEMYYIDSIEEAAEYIVNLAKLSIDTGNI